MQSQTRDVPAKPRRKPRQSCLVIEDSHFDQKRISRALEHGCQHLDLIFADTIAAAREHLAKTPVQMILLDNHLPDGVGADFAIELSNDPKHSKKPIVMVSDWPSPLYVGQSQRCRCAPRGEQGQVFTQVTYNPQWNNPRAACTDQAVQSTIGASRPRMARAGLATIWANRATCSGLLCATAL